MAVGQDMKIGVTRRVRPRAAAAALALLLLPACGDDPPRGSGASGTVDTARWPADCELRTIEKQYADVAPGRYGGGAASPQAALDQLLAPADAGRFAQTENLGDERIYFERHAPDGSLVARALVVSSRAADGARDGWVARRVDYCEGQLDG